MSLETPQPPKMESSANAIDPIDHFIHFSRLPPELRLKIWGHALDLPRIVLVTVASIVHCEVTDRCNCVREVAKPQLPPLLLACQESRFAALKKYQQCFQNPNFSPWPHYFNFGSDVLFVRGLSRCYRTNQVSAFVHSIPAMDQVQALAVPLNELASHLFNPDQPYWTLGRSVRKLIVVMNALPKGKGELTLSKGKEGRKRSLPVGAWLKGFCKRFDRHPVQNAVEEYLDKQSAQYPEWKRPIVELMWVGREKIIKARS